MSDGVPSAEPLLRRMADREIDTSRTVEATADEILDISAEI
jgi:hypothetical protein